LFNRLGFGGSGGDHDDDAHHPGQQDHIVIFVVGGISYKEAHQVQKVLLEHQRTTTGIHVTLMSTTTISSEEIIPILFQPFPII
jgi:hypothetical protein